MLTAGCLAFALRLGRGKARAAAYNEGKRPKLC